MQVRWQLPGTGLSAMVLDPGLILQRFLKGGKTCRKLYRQRNGETRRENRKQNPTIRVRSAPVTFLVETSLWVCGVLALSLLCFGVGPIVGRR